MRNHNLIICFVRVLNLVSNFYGKTKTAECGAQTSGSKVKFTLKEATKAQKYCSFLSSTSALVGSGKSTPRPGRFTHVKETRFPLYRRLSGPQRRSGYVRKISQNMDKISGSE